MRKRAGAATYVQPAQIRTERQPSKKFGRNKPAPAPDVRLVGVSSRPYVGRLVSCWMLCHHYILRLSMALAISRNIRRDESGIMSKEDCIVLGPTAAYIAGLTYCYLFCKVKSKPL